jgi:hypothetical protein
LEVDVRVDRKENASLYLVRIGASQKAALENGGRAFALSPPVPAASDDLPQTGFAVITSATESLAIDREGPQGVMTLLLLARKEPLPDAFRGELNRAFQLRSINQAALAKGPVERFEFSNPGPTRELSQFDLQPLIDQHQGTVPMDSLIQALLPYFNRIEVVLFDVPELRLPAEAQPAPDRKTQP